MKYNKIGNTDMTVSHMSLGCSAFGSVFRKTDDAECIQVLNEAIDKGVNMLDTAPWYGHGKSENVLGMALPSIPRDKYFINTKVGRYEADAKQMFDFSAERVIRSVDESLQRMNISYVDIIQIHDMEFAEDLSVIWKETLPALQKVKESGKARYIGITGYPIENFKTVIENSTVKIDSILTYCHGSLNDNTLQEHVQYFQDKGVGIINASSLSMGLLTNRGPPEWHPAMADIKEACRGAADYCQNKGFDISKLSCKFAFEQPGIATTLISTASLKNLATNFEAAETELTKDEKLMILELQERFFDKLERKHWEGMEVDEYWKMLGKKS